MAASCHGGTPDNNRKPLPARQQRLNNKLSDWLDVDLWSAGELASDLAAGGLVTLTGETIELAAAGAALRERIRREIAAVMAPVWEQLDPADIETTLRTLARVTTLARAARPAAVPAPATGES